MAKITFKVETRDLLGKKVKQLRRELIIPGNVYGPEIGSQAIKLVWADFEQLYDEAGETSVIYLQLTNQDGEEKEHPVLIDEVQLDPASSLPLHVSFKEVNLSKKIEAEIPLEITGEFSVSEAVMVQTRTSIEVEALPTDLPEKFAVDVSILKEVGQMITLADLNFDKDKVTLLEVETDEDLDKPIVLVQEQRKEEEAEATLEDVEILGEDGKVTDGTASDKGSEKDGAGETEASPAAEGSSEATPKSTD